VIAGYNYGLQSSRMCQRYTRQWDSRPGRLAGVSVAAATAFAAAHLPDRLLRSVGPAGRRCLQRPRRPVERAGRASTAEFIASYDDPGSGSEHIDLRCLPAQLRLEMQYVLQCRRDEQKAKVLPSAVQPIVRSLAAAKLSSLLDEPEYY
jgi:hypothetical protein